MALSQFDSLDDELAAAAFPMAGYLVALPWVSAFLIALVPASGALRAAAWIFGPCALATLLLLQFLPSSQDPRSVESMATAAASCALLCMFIVFVGRRTALARTGQARIRSGSSSA
jgi:hypothetical protein